MFESKSRLIFCEFFEPLDAYCPFSFQIDIQSAYVHYMVLLQERRSLYERKPYFVDFKYRMNLHFGGNKMNKTITITMILMLLIVVSCANMSSSEKGALTGGGIGVAAGAAITAIAGGNAAVLALVPEIR